MKTHNIFMSADIHGILAHKKNGSTKTVKELIISHYGFDPTSPVLDPELIEILQNRTPPLFGWTDYKQIPDYVRLISSKDSSDGHKITPQDIENGRIKNLYELQVSASVGDVVRWWGHTVDAMNPTQCIISGISHMHTTNYSSITTPEITNGNVSFYFASRIYDQEPSDGVRVETNSAYTLDLTVPADWQGKVINYDIEILLLSGPANTSHGLMTYPIAKLVVDPTINVN
ncbi:AidA/PixA family protein [Photobacterium chitinilyticum]|uniref:Uncharacterized protein n=1 Tax=Photobacterium chitinilyticum TaxID=2485123 RepID=A0A3S3QM85_9GAMM|nr:AidA/PixA family protein [Photobacterium chitinilyticum]RWX53404.1 hypothetical protein EDI28_21505 [Photobacterium chitinilyticum]